MVFSLKFYTQPSYQSNVRIKKYSEWKNLKILFSCAFFLRKLFENVIHGNDGVNEPKKKKETRSNTGDLRVKGDFEDNDRKF